MIDKAKSIESFIELIERINEGKADKLSVELFYRDGMKVEMPIPCIEKKRTELKLVRGDRDEA